MSAVPTVDITTSALYTLFGNWLISLLGSGAVIEQGQQNRISMPQGNYVVMTLIGPSKDLHKGARDQQWIGGSSNPGTEKDTKPAEEVLQLDFYGPGAKDASKLVQLIVSTQNNFDYFAQQVANGGPEAQPLYAGQARNLTLVNGEGQYESRWGFDLHFQYNPIITFPQNFLIGLDIHAVTVDSQFPPE